MALFLRPCVIGGQTAPDDYSVVEDGTVIGRIRRATERKDEVWEWTITVHLPGPPYGSAGSLDQAKTEFRAAWSAWRPANR